MRWKVTQKEHKVTRPKGRWIQLLTPMVSTYDSYVEGPCRSGGHLASDGTRKSKEKFVASAGRVEKGTEESPREDGE